MQPDQVDSPVKLAPAFETDAAQESPQPNIEWCSSFESFTTFACPHVEVRAFSQPPKNGSQLTNNGTDRVTRLSLFTSVFDLLYHSIPEDAVSVTHPDYDGDLQEWLEDTVLDKTWSWTDNFAEKMTADRKELFNDDWEYFDQLGFVEKYLYYDNDDEPFNKQVRESLIPETFSEISPAHKTFKKTLQDFVEIEFGTPFTREEVWQTNTHETGAGYVVLVDRAPNLTKDTINAD